MGSVCLLGAGPGDPELITVRAVRRLREADVVLYDALAHPDLLSHCPPEAEKLFVGKRAGRVSERQADINRRLVEFARQGKRVVRLKGGDPYLFGRGSEEAEALHEAGVPFEVVPGVPSPLAGTAYAGISLTHRDLASSVAYVTATESPVKDATSHDWSALATATQTLVIFMGLRKLRSLMELLRTHGRGEDTPVAVISRASLPGQQTLVGTLADIADRVEASPLQTPALTVVGDVVRLREHLRWFDLQPLFGKRVLVTRPAGQAAGMVQMLRDAGADPIEIPTVRIVDPDDLTPLEDALQRLEDYDWVVFTSRNGVERFFAALHAASGDARRLGTASVAAIGPATAQALTAHGVRADLVPEEYRGEAVADALLEQLPDETHNRVLIPRAAVAREVLPERLRAAGVEVDVVPVYETVGATAEQLKGIRQMLERGELDVATFTSSSTVQRLLDDLGAEGPQLLARTCVAAIGPITAQTAREAGVTVNVVAEQYTAPELVQALVAHFAANG